MAVSHVKNDTIADFTGTFTGFNSQGSTTTIAATDIVRPSDWNSAHNQFYTLIGNTTGNSTASGTDVQLAASGGVTIWGSTGTVGISVQPPYTASFFEPEIYGGTLSGTQANGTVYIRPFHLENYVDAARGVMLYQATSQSQTTMTISASVSNPSSTAATGSWGLTGTNLFFSRQSTGTNANSTNIITFKSGSYSMSAGYSMSVSWVGAGSSATATMSTSAAMGFITSIGSAGAVTTTSTTSSGSTTFSSTSTNLNSFSTSFVMSFVSAHMSAVRPIFFPIGTTFTPGEYWYGHIQSTQTGSTNYSLQRIVSMNSIGLVYYSTMIGTNYAEVGNSATIGSSNVKWGIGSYSASQSTTSTIQISNISNMSAMSLYFNLDGNVK